MPITKSTLSIPGAEIEAANPLPYLKATPENIIFGDDGTLTAREQKLFGFQSSRRVLPYLMQDRYSRKRPTMELKTIILENEILKATFLPEYGGRLYSLYHKELGRDLLYKNTVFQPSNLAIRNAWFSGGVEWNIGRVGHTFSTCDPVFFASVKGEDGETFLRMYEFERQHRLFWQIDFHLPSGAGQLAAHVRIVNDDIIDKPMYWWTNTAIPETDHVRVFSESPEAFYLKPESVADGNMVYGHAKFPHIPAISQGDVTYPAQIPYSSEYFFQNEESDSTAWEAASYDSGYLFYECSSAPLTYRKLFAWGTSDGGRQWCDYLSEAGMGDYVEIQAGLAPSQVHGYIMQGNSTLTFTQLFGGLIEDDLSSLANDAYAISKQAVKSLVTKALPEKVILQLHEKYAKTAQNSPLELLSFGSGFGALEVLRREQEKEALIPKGFLFPMESLTEEQKLWKQVLIERTFPELDVNECPASFMTDENWRGYLEQIYQVSPDNWALCFYYAVFLYENDDYTKALAFLQRSFLTKPNAWAIRTKAEALRKNSDLKGSDEEIIIALKMAYDMGGQTLFPAFAEELIEMYTKTKRYEEAWQLYIKESQLHLPSERFLLHAAKAGLEMGDSSVALYLFENPPAIIREGESSLTFLWYEYTARQLAAHKKLPYSEAFYWEVVAAQTPPKILNYSTIPLIKTR